MPVQIYNADGDFVGAIERPRSYTCALALSEAGSLEVSAPYVEWRDLFTIEDFSSHIVEIIGPAGEEVLRGRWLVSGHTPLDPGQLAVEGTDLLEELRTSVLPPDYVVSYVPLLTLLTVLLESSDSDWVLGDTSRALNSYVTEDFSGMTYLEAVLEACRVTGNYCRHDGWNRTLDVFTTAFTDYAAYLVAAQPDDPDAAGVGGLPSKYGLIEGQPQVDVDASEVLRAVFAQGASFLDETNKEQLLTPTGEETLPAGFSFETLQGQMAIVNDAVTTGLLRVAEFALIRPLSNTDITAQGEVQASGPNWIESNTLRRPNDGFWDGSTLNVQDLEYTVGGHSGRRITGNWGTLAVGTEFAVVQSFDYDADAIEQARQSLVNAAVGRLKAHGDLSYELSLAVTGLKGTTVLPGDTVRLDVVGNVELYDALTAIRKHHVWSGAHADMVVVRVQKTLRGSEIAYRFDLANALGLLPTEEGLREIQETQGLRSGRGTRYNVGKDTIDDTFINWGTEGDQVNASAMPIINSAGYFVGSSVEEALTELADGTVVSDAYLLTTGTRPGATDQAQDFGINGILTDVIAESTPGAGVTIDGIVLALHATRHDVGGADPLSTVPDHIHQGGVGDGAKIDHGVALLGLLDDDHPQYLLVNGTRPGATTQAQDFGANGIETDLIVESTPATGVTIETVLLENGNITMPDNAWIGLGAAAGRIMFDNLATDEIKFLACKMVVEGYVELCSLAGRAYLMFASSANDMAMSFRNNAGACRWEWRDDAGTFELNEGVNTNNRITVLPGGNFGVGTQAPAGQAHIDQSSATGAKPVLVLDQADIDYVLMKIIGTAAAASADRTLVAASDFTTPGALVGWIQIEVEDVGNRIADADYWMPIYATPTA